MGRTLPWCQSEISGYHFDETPRYTFACAAFFVWALEFVCILLFFHPCCLSIWPCIQSVNHCQRSYRRMVSVDSFCHFINCFFFWQIWFWRLIVSLGLDLWHNKSASVCGGCFWLILFPELKCQTSVPLLSFFFLLFRPNSCFVLFNLTTKSIPSFIGDGRLCYIFWLGHICSTATFFCFCEFKAWKLGSKYGVDIQSSLLLSHNSYNNSAGLFEHSPRLDRHSSHTLTPAALNTASVHLQAATGH